MNGLKTVHLVLTYHWFDEIESGRKKVEYRERTDRWAKRLIIDRPVIAIFHRGYTKTTMAFGIIQIIVHPTFFALELGRRLDSNNTRIE